MWKLKEIIICVVCVSCSCWQRVKENEENERYFCGTVHQRSSWWQMIVWGRRAWGQQGHWTTPWKKEKEVCIYIHVHMQKGEEWSFT